MRHLSLILLLILGATAPLQARKPLIGGPKTIPLDATENVSEKGGEGGDGLWRIFAADSIDAEPRWLGIAKDGQVGVEVGDNFMSGFAGNGIKNVWYTAGNRPLFGTGSTGALSELSPLIRTAREKKISLLFYRFKVQFADIDANKGVFFSSIKGENVLHMMSADCAVFTPEHTLGGMLKLKANLTAGSGYVQESQGKENGGNYVIVADPERYSSDALRLIHATSKQMAQALRAAQ